MLDYFHSNTESSRQQAVSWADYKSVAQTILQRHRPERYDCVPISEWPADLRHDPLVLSKATNGEVVAMFEPNAGPPHVEVAALIAPATYTVPCAKPPLAQIETPPRLSDAGQCVYEAFNRVGIIATSRHEEPGNRRELARCIQRLHEQHAYPLAEMQAGLLAAAQQRDDLP